MTATKPVSWAKELVERRVIVRAAGCGHHKAEDCEGCRDARALNNAMLDELRTLLERQEQAAGKLAEIALRVSRGAPLRMDAFNEVLGGKDTMQAMLLRDDEEGSSSILAQNMTDQDACDISEIINILTGYHEAHHGN